MRPGSIINHALFSKWDPRFKKALKEIYNEWRLLKYHKQGVRYVQRNCGNIRPLRVQFGCGPILKEGWLNTDLWPGPWSTPDICLDVSRPLPFASNSVAEIYSEHMFEHLDYPTAAGLFLSECQRILEPGGKISIGVPDLDVIYEDYERLVKSNSPASEMKPQFILGDPVEELNYFFHQSGEHKFLYNEHFLVALMHHFGFSEAKRRPFDPVLDSEHRRIGTLYVTATKK